jgi:hypothetical protein
VKKYWPALAILALLLLGTVQAANAASVKICYDDASVSPGVTSINVLYHPTTGSDVTTADVLAGSVLTGSVRCATQPIPALLVRGTTYAVTLKATNAFAEVGPASNAVTFLPPNLPAVITGVSVQIVVP